MPNNLRCGDDFRQADETQNRAEDDGQNRVVGNKECPSVVKPNDRADQQRLVAA